MLAKNRHDRCQQKTLVVVGQKMTLEDIYQNKTLANVNQK